MMENKEKPCRKSRQGSGNYGLRLNIQKKKFQTARATDTTVSRTA
jgi:hypothetical protein